MVILGFLLMCFGFALAIFVWGLLMTYGWTGMWFERKEVRRAMKGRR